MRIVIQKRNQHIVEVGPQRTLPEATYARVIGGSVGVSEILAQIDREIAQLQQARALLNGSSKSQSAKSAGRKARAKKRRLTPEGRRRIAEAVKRRWAEQRKRAAAAGK